MRYPEILVYSCVLQQFVLEWIVYGKTVAQFFAGVSNGVLDLLGLAIDDGGNFLHRKTLDGMEYEGFPVLAGSPAQSELNESDHFGGIGDRFRSRNTIVGDAALRRHGFIGLMKLKSGFVAGALAAAAA